ncbi:MAG: hydratase [Bauldia sp.]|nr:hydratase [Bauldia sp.]
MASGEEEASALLWRLWQDRAVIDDLPPDLKPATREAGYAIQAHLERFSASPRFGWKIAATSAAGQRHINVSGPMAGRLLAEKVLHDGDTVSVAGNRMSVCEAEFAFWLGADLPPRPEPYGMSEVLAAVADMCLTIELPDSRFADFTGVGEAALIADNACASDLILGPRVTADWRSMDLAAHRVTGRVEGRYDREGVGANVLGDPRIALTWLANELSGLGIGFRRGELATCGTCLVPLEVVPGDRVVADFGILGSVQAKIAEPAG